jgi:protein-disulfide isomerase
MPLNRLFYGLIALMLALPILASPAGAQIAGGDKRAIEDIVRQYILDNPEIIAEAITRLRQRGREARAQSQQRARTDNAARIFDNPLTPEMGNPNGDVTVVEFFDYQCGYCKQVLPAFKKVIESDKNLRVLMKELPILGPVSRFAARASMASEKQGLYFPYHIALMELNGRLSEKRVIDTARKVGLDIETLVKDMADPAIDAYLDQTLELAQLLGINGTPAFLFGNQLVPGAIKEDQMRAFIAAARKPKS